MSEHTVVQFLPQLPSTSSYPHCPVSLEQYLLIIELQSFFVEYLRGKSRIFHDTLVPFYYVTHHLALLATKTLNSCCHAHAFAA